MEDERYLKSEIESREKYIHRMYSNKTQFNMINREIAEVINQELGTDFQESYFRGIYKIYEIACSECLESLKGDKEVKNKIDEIAELIGELDVKKMLVRNDTTKLNKIKRDFVKTIEIANDLKECMLENYTDFPKFEYEIITDVSNNKLIVQVSDWHVGYVINGYKGNYYNYEITKLVFYIILIQW